MGCTKFIKKQLAATWNTVVNAYPMTVKRDNYQHMIKGFEMEDCEYHTSSTLEGNEKIQENK